SPQQIRGERPDPRDDVHAMGVIWYQILTGDPSAAASADWREELAEKQVPDEVVSLLGECMAAKTERRPADAAAFLGKLSRLRPASTEPKGRPESVPPIPPILPTTPRPVSGGTWLNDVRWYVAFGVLAVAVVVGILAYRTYHGKDDAR